MARFKLTVAKLKSLPAGKQSDGDGPWIYKSVTSGSWVYRYTIAGRRRETGLGSYPDVSLAQAREKAEASRQTRAKGLDPLTERVLEKNRNRKATLFEIGQEAFEAYTPPPLKVMVGGSLVFAFAITCPAKTGTPAHYGYRPE